MIRSLTILTVITTLVGCGGVGGAQNAPQKPQSATRASSADNELKVDKADSIGVQQRTFVVANLRPAVEKVTLVNAQFAGIPLPGQKFEGAEEAFVQSVTSSGPRNTFALAGKPSSAGKLSVFFGDQEQPAASYTYNASLNSVVLNNPPAQYTSIRVRYQVVTGTATVTGPVAMLSHKPEKDTVKLNNPNCDVASGGVHVENEVLVFLCGAMSVGTELMVEYSYFDSQMQTYDMKDVKTPEEGIWEVKVDGKTYDKYKRDNTKISIPEFLPPGAYVEIIFKRQGS